MYLAGPEVFFPADLRDSIDEKKKSVLADHGLKGLSPMDNAVDLDSAGDLAQAIYDANLALMGKAEGIIANLTPFRGPSSDAGTIYELGYMVAMGKAAVGFTTCATPYNQRVSPEGATCSHGAAIEPFGLCDNLMLDCGLVRAGGALVRGNKTHPPGGLPLAAFFDEGVFGEAARRLRAILDRRG